MKISIITAVYNRARYIADAINSVKRQTHPNIEHVVIDGGSTDGTQNILMSLQLREGAVLVSERDFGLYDALNKGFARATGDVLGILHSDDLFSDDCVLAWVATAFVDPTIDAVYGDLEYVSRSDANRVLRYWQSGEFEPSRLRRGWMPPHPALFLRRRVLERWGAFDTRYTIAADYDAILRYFGKGKIRAAYIPRVMVRMRLGGESNKSLRKILRKTQEDYLVLRRSGIGGVGVLMCKNLRKVKQFFVRY